MAFNSFAFALFLPTVLALYWLARRHRGGQNWLLLAASYVFYGWWDWRFLSLLLVSSAVDYVVALRITALRAAAVEAARPAMRRWLFLSVGANLGMLGFFKYWNFFADSTVRALGAVGLSVQPFVLDIVLPVGISFYSFQTLSYTIDVYRGEMPATRSFRDFALYVAFFPQLVAGPIERAVTLLPQMLGPRRFDAAQFADGLHLIVWGLFKKVFVADNLAPYVNRVFASPDPTGFEAVAAVYAFAFQIYGDFSGYSDIARGCSKCMGFELMHNFRFPYVAVNPSDFWRRWHISLSTWLRDYLYIALGGNRRGEWLTYRNLALTMLLGGLWHGATWLFVLWGAYQGLLLVLHRLAQPWLARAGAALPVPVALGRAVRVGVMFQFVCLGWLIFRGESVAQIGTMLHALLTWRGDADWASIAPLAATVAPLIALEALMARGGVEGLHRLRWLPAPARAVVYGVVCYLFAFHGAAAQSFIYFQF